MEVLKSARPCLLGLCMCHIWIYCTTHRFTFSDDISVMAVMYAALSCFLIGLFAVVRRATHRGRTPENFPSRRAALALDTAAAVCMALCAVCLTVPLPFMVANSSASNFTVVAASVLGGVGIAWAYMRWGQVYAKLDIRLAAPLIFLTMAVGSACKALIDLLPPVAAAVVLVAVSAAAFLLMRASLANVPPAAKPVVFYTGRTVNSLIRLAAGIAVYSLTTGVIQSMLLETSSLPAGAIIVHHASEVVVGLAMFVWVATFKRGLDFSRTWRLILVLMGTALIFEPHFSAEATTYLLSFIRTAQTFLIVFLFLALGDIARHSPYHPMAVFSLGWCAYTLPFMVGKVVGDELVSLGSNASFVTSAIVWVLLVVMLFVLDDASAGNRLIFTELNEGLGDDTLASRMASVQRELDDRADQTPEQADPLTKRCCALSEAAGLTPREREILEMLVRGRSKVHIAEAFLISENTVRGHVKHIYAKLDVHGKQELLDRVEAVPL